MIMHRVSVHERGFASRSRFGPTLQRRRSATPAAPGRAGRHSGVRRLVGLALDELLELVLLRRGVVLGPHVRAEDPHQLRVAGGLERLAALVALDDPHLPSYPSVLSRLYAALISARWVNACGKLPSSSPVGPISSEYRPRWFAYVSIFSNARRASSSRPERVSASTYQNEQIENVPSSPRRPSGDASTL